MPANPTVGSVHQNAALPGLAIGGYNQQFQARRIFAPVAVDKETDSYAVWDAGDILRSEARIVRPGSKTPRGGFATSFSTFQLAEWKFAWPIPKRVRLNADLAIAREMQAARRVGQKVGLAQEKEIIRIVTTTAWTGDDGVSGLDLNGAWDASNPTQDPAIPVTALKLAIQNKIGQRVNTMALGYNVYENLRINPYIKEAMGISGGTGRPMTGVAGPALINEAVLSIYFDIPNIIVIDAIENTANSGATDVFASVMGDDVFLCYASPSAAVDEPSAGYLFYHTEWGSEVNVRTWREDDPEQDVYEGSAMFQAAPTLLAAGGLITDVLLAAE